MKRIVALSLLVCAAVCLILSADANSKLQGWTPLSTSDKSSLIAGGWLCSKCSDPPSQGTCWACHVTGAKCYTRRGGYDLPWGCLYYGGNGPDSGCTSPATGYRQCWVAFQSFAAMAVQTVAGT